MTRQPPQYRNMLSDRQISCHLSASDRDGAVRELLALLEPEVNGFDAETAFRAVIDREEVFPTVIAPGLAVPHARLPDLDRPLLAVGIAPEGIDFQQPEMPPVRVAVLILTPGDDPGLHLQLLSGLTAVFKETPDAVERLARMRAPEEVREFLAGGRHLVPDFLTARDLMDRKIPVLREEDSVQSAIHTFAVSGFGELPVLDREDDLRGVLSIADLLQLSLPEHLLWMEDLSPFYRFQPFSEMLRNAGETKIADVMREEYLKVSERMPAIQLAKLFLVNKVLQIIVVDDRDRLAGVVTMRDFCAKLFWE